MVRLTHIARVTEDAHVLLSGVMALSPGDDVRYVQLRDLSKMSVAYLTNATSAQFAMWAISLEYQRSEGSTSAATHSVRPLSLTPSSHFYTSIQSSLTLHKIDSPSH